MKAAKAPTPTLPRKGGGRRLAIGLRLILIVSGLGVAGFLYAFPLYWLIATSLKGKAELYQAITLAPAVTRASPVNRGC